MGASLKIVFDNETSAKYWKNCIELNSKAVESVEVEEER